MVMRLRRVMARWIEPLIEEIFCRQRAAQCIFLSCLYAQDFRMNRKPGILRSAGFLMLGQISSSERSAIFINERSNPIFSGLLPCAGITMRSGRPSLVKNMVAAFDAHARPPGVLNRTGKRFPCDLFQTASSKICSSLPGEVLCSPASSHNSTASRRFACNSSRVSAWVTQPGSAGTSAQYPPSSALWTIALMIIRGI